MHGRHLVEEIGFNQLQTRLEQLSANNQRHDPTDHEHAQTENEIHRTDVFVVRCKQPATNALCRTVVVRIFVFYVR